MSFKAQLELCGRRQDFPPDAVCVIWTGSTATRSKSNIVTIMNLMLSMSHVGQPHWLPARGTAARLSGRLIS